MWPRCFAVGGKTNFWGRSSARFGDIDFRAASSRRRRCRLAARHTKEIAPYYSRVERMIGVASTVQNRPSNPDGDYLPAFNFRCSITSCKRAVKQIGRAVPAGPYRAIDASLTRASRLPLLRRLHRQAATRARSSRRPWRFLPRAEKLAIWRCARTRSAKNILVDENGMRERRSLHRSQNRQEVEVRAARWSWRPHAWKARGSCSIRSRSHWPDGIANSSGQLGRNLCDHLYGESANGHLPQLLGQPSFPDNVSASDDCMDAALAESRETARRRNSSTATSVYPWGGCSEYPWYCRAARGLRLGIQTRGQAPYYPTPITFTIQAPSLPSPEQLHGYRSEGERPVRHPVARECISSGDRTS